MKIIHDTIYSISICDFKNDNNTVSFAKVLINDAEVEYVNPDFKKEVEAFAGKGFLEAYLKQKAEALADE